MPADPHASAVALVCPCVQNLRCRLLLCAIVEGLITYLQVTSTELSTTWTQQPLPSVVLLAQHHLGLQQPREQPQVSLQTGLTDSVACTLATRHTNP